MGRLTTAKTNERLLVKYKAFIDELKKHGDVGAACKVAGISVKLAAHRRTQDPVFEADWELALRDSGKISDYHVFLDVISKTGNRTEALRLSGLTTAEVLSRKRSDPEFAALWDEAEYMATDELEAEARRRAIHGVQKQVFYQGEPVWQRDGTGHLMRDEIGGLIPVYETTYSDKMLEIMLKANRPEKFRENVKVDHAVTGGVLMIPMAPATEDEWEANAARSLRRIEDNKRMMDANAPVIIDQ